MSYYEYMVAPAPKSAPRTKGIKGTDALVAHELAATLNGHAGDGWEFIRTETIVVETKPGFFARPRLEQASVMIFRRWIETAAAAAGQAAEPAAASTEPTDRRPSAAPPLTASRRPEGALHPVSRPNRS